MFVGDGLLRRATNRDGLPRQGVPVVKSKLKPCEGGEPFSCEGLGKPRGFVACYNVAVLQKGCHLGQMLVLDDLGDDFT